MVAGYSLALPKLPQRSTVMKTILVPFLLAAALSAALANTAPTPVVVSAAMRPGTTFMDVVYRVNDPDDATVKVRALAFVDGVRSFAKVLRPVTFVEGTAAKIGDAIPANTDHTLTWDVGADWNIDLGQVKFEILARDRRGLLPFDWITIPAVGANPALTISKDAPSAASVLSALFWQYADGDSSLSLANGSLKGTAASGVFNNLEIANGSGVKTYGTPYILKQMNLDAAGAGEVAYASNARAGIQNTTGWHAVARAWAGITPLITWGASIELKMGITNVIKLDASGSNFLALNSDGGVTWIGTAGSAPPDGLINVTSIAAGNNHSLALKSDGTVVGWGQNDSGQATPPAGLSNVTAIAAGNNYSLALKSDGTVVGWGSNNSGQTTIPAGLSGVTAIAAGETHCLALKSDGTVVGWGQNGGGRTTPPAGLSSVTAIAAGCDHSLALKSDGKVVGWGDNSFDQSTPPGGLSDVIAIAAGAGGNRGSSLALISGGTVVGWGSNIGGPGEVTPPSGLTGVIAITIGKGTSMAVLPKAP